MTKPGSLFGQTGHPHRSEVAVFSFGGARR